MIPLVHVVGEPLFRLWIVECEAWQGTTWHEAPPRARAIEPIEEGLLTAREAASFPEGFNGALAGSDRPLWAVAVPIRLTLAGDAQPGMELRGLAPQSLLEMAPQHEMSATLAGSEAGAACDPATEMPELAIAVPADSHRAGALHVHGFGQSPQRSK